MVNLASGGCRQARAGDPRGDPQQRGVRLELLHRQRALVGRARKGLHRER